MKKIAYIEIDTHAEIAADFMDLMEDSEEFSVDYYFSERIKNRVQKRTDRVFLSDNSMILDQLEDQNYDLIIIGTVHRYFNTFLTVSQKYKTAIIVHNLNFSKASGFSLIKNVLKEDWVYRLKLWWKEGLFNASKVYQNAQRLLVLDRSFSSGRYQFLPLFYTKQFEPIKNDFLTVVIPGGVSQKRRDYRRILNKIKTSESEQKIEFVFLGKAKGEELKWLKNIETQHSIKYFTERLSEDDFNHWMKKADVLWCLIQQETKFFSVKEMYGKTKMTGNIGDAIKFGKMAVFPENYKSDLKFIVPEKQDVIQQFFDLKNFKYDFQKDFSREKVLKDLEILLNRFI